MPDVFEAAEFVIRCCGSFHDEFKAKEQEAEQGHAKLASHIMEHGKPPTD